MVKRLEEYYDRYWKGEVKIQEPPVTMPQRKYFVDIIRPYLKGKCLDIGCGNGNLTNLISGIVEASGCDVSKVAIASAKKRFPKIKFKTCSVTDLAFKDKEFDCASSFEVVEHVYDNEKAFCEFNRVLKKGGYLFVSTPVYTPLKNLLITLFMWDEYFNPNHPHVRFYTKKSLYDMLRKHGFRPVKYMIDGRVLGIIPKAILVIAKKVKDC